MQSRGARVLGRNVRVGGGELDLVVSLAGERIAVEVKAAVDDAGDPIYHFDANKQRQVRSLALQHGVHRVDYIGVKLSADGATVRWLPRVC